MAHEVAMRDEQPEEQGTGELDARAHHLELGDGPPHPLPAKPEPSRPAPREATPEASRVRYDADPDLPLPGPPLSDQALARLTRVAWIGAMLVIGVALLRPLILIVEYLVLVTIRFPVVGIPILLVLAGAGVIFWRRWRARP